MRSLQALDFESCRLGFNQNGYKIQNKIYT